MISRPENVASFSNRFAIRPANPLPTTITTSASIASPTLTTISWLRTVFDISFQCKPEKYSQGIVRNIYPTFHIVDQYGTVFVYEA